MYISFFRRTVSAGTSRDTAQSALAFSAASTRGEAIRSAARAADA